MLTLDLTSPRLDLDGVPIADCTLARDLSEMLAGTNSPNAMRCYEWAVALRKTGSLQLDTTARDELRKFIEQSPLGSNLIKGQLLLKLSTSS